MMIRPFLVVGLLWAAAAPVAKRNLQVDDLFRIKTVGDPQVSPDGRWVAYTVATVSLKEDESETRDWGNKDTQDVLASVDHAIAQGYVDPHRLGVGGWSYGGILTNYVISQTDRFKAAISGAGGALWTGLYGHDHYQLEYEVELGLPWKNREVWERLSSAYYDVEKITTPTLYMGGAQDWNVPIIGSEQMYQALRRLGRKTQLVVYPGQHHGIRKPTYQKDRYQRYLAWYDKYVKGGGETAAAK